MPNTIITPQTIARRALATLYNTAVLANLVYRDYDEDFTGKQGNTVNVRTPATFVANEFDRNVGIVLQAITEGSFPVVLDKIVDVSFAITAEELTLEIDNFDERILTPAMEAIVHKVEGDLALAFVTAARGVGGGGVVTVDDTDAARSGPLGVRTRLYARRLPTSERYAAYSPESAEVLLGDDLFVKADARGDTDGLREASIGRKFGIDHVESQVFGRGDQVVDDPEDIDGLEAAVDADAVGFHRTAVALASRTLELPMGTADGQAAVANYKSFGLRVVKGYNQTLKQDVISIDFLYGVKVVRPYAAVELDFGLGVS